MIRRLSETERTLALQRLEAANERIADLEAGIQRLREKGLPTVEAERLLRLIRRSHVVMRRYADLLTNDKT
ncbi:MAG TPA: hypothetical protein VJV39_18120 [Dongiaceae bacterium]|nr:hypothetical protein [Dongiaceae bacterium]